LPVACTVGIDGNLEMPKELRGILDFVDNDRGRVTLEKSLWFLLGLLGFGREIKGDEGVIRKQVPEGAGLAGLPSAGQNDHRARFRRTLQMGLDIARNPHMQNIRCHRTFCTT
jgi:hypothetical protein